MGVAMDALTAANGLVVFGTWAAHWAPGRQSIKAPFTYVAGILILALGIAAYAMLAHTGCIPVPVLASLAVSCGGADFLAYGIDALAKRMKELQTLRRVTGKKS